MKFLCIFLFFLGVSHDFTGAKFVERFKWKVPASDKLTIFGVRPWKNKLFVTTPTGLLYANLSSSGKATNPPLTPQYLQAPNTHVEVDLCDRLWLYEYKTQHLTVIDLNRNLTLEQVKIHAPADWGFTGRIKVNVNKTDCNDAYAYLTSEQKIYVYSLKKQQLWERGITISVDKTGENFTFCREHGIGMYSTSRNFSGGIDLLRLLRPSATTAEKYLHAVPFDALQKFENRWRNHFRKFILFSGTQTVVGRKGRELAHLAAHNSTLFFTKHRGRKIWCWNMKSFPNKVTIYEVKKFTERIYDMRMDEQKTLWVLTYNERKNTTTNNLLNRMKQVVVYTESKIKDMVKGTICD